MANAVRRARAQLKCDIAAGMTSAADVLLQLNQYPLRRAQTTPGAVGEAIALA